MSGDVPCTGPTFGEKIGLFGALAEAYASLRREHTNVACEWRIAREVDWKALSYSLPASSLDLLSRCSCARIRYTIMEAQP